MNSSSDKKKYDVPAYGITFYKIGNLQLDVGNSGLKKCNFLHILTFDWVSSCPNDKKLQLKNYSFFIIQTQIWYECSHSINVQVSMRCNSLSSFSLASSLIKNKSKKKKDFSRKTMITFYFVFSFLTKKDLSGFLNKSANFH